MLATHRQVRSVSGRTMCADLISTEQYNQKQTDEPSHVSCNQYIYHGCRHYGRLTAIQRSPPQPDCHWSECRSCQNNRSALCRQTVSGTAPCRRYLTTTQQVTLAGERTTGNHDTLCIGLVRCYDRDNFENGSTIILK